MDTVKQYGDLILSPGLSFDYVVIGPVCRLYDREELPYPSCSLSWRGKQPSWNRVGKRFVPDMACTRSPSYSVKLVYYDVLIKNECYKILTLYPQKLDTETKQWWYTKAPTKKLEELNAA